MSDAVHQIGEVAEAVGLSLRTIRYYDEVGLAVPSGRSTGGFRLYTDADIDRLRFIRDLKPLDFSLDEIHDLLDALEAVASVKTRAAAAKRLVRFAEIGQQRCDELTEQVRSAERVVDRIRTSAAPIPARGAASR